MLYCLVLKEHFLFTKVHKSLELDRELKDLKIRLLWFYQPAEIGDTEHTLLMGSEALYCSLPA